MTHNPIIKQSKIGMFSHPEIGMTQQGVIQQGMNYRRLSPKQKLGRGELLQLRNSTLYIVDCRSHNWSWEVQLPSQDDNHPFKYRIKLSYRIDDPIPVVQQNVVDLERQLQQKLLPELRQATHNAQLNNHKQIGKRLIGIISNHGVFLDYGLSLGDDIRLTSLLSKEAQQFVDELDQLIKARTIPRQIKCEGTLPTNQALYKFKVEANIQYLLVDDQRIRSIKSLEENVNLLWKTQIHKKIRKTSRQYSYKEIGEADAAIDAILDDENFADYGVRIVSASVNLQLDTAGQKAAEEDELLERGFEKDIKQQHHVQQNMLKDRMSVLANLYSKGEYKLQEVLNYLDEKEIEAAGIPLDMIEKLQDLDVLDRDTAEDVAKALLGSTLAAAATKQMPSEQNELLATLLNRAQLSSKSTVVDNDDEDDEDAD